MPCVFFSRCAGRRRLIPSQDVRGGLRLRGILQSVVFALALLLAQAGGALSLNAASLADRIAEITGTSAAERAFWGIQVVDLEDGRIVYSKHEHKLFLPASNGKLFSTALALSRLGPQYFHTTAVVSNAAVDADGTLEGDLVLLGGGDPEPFLALDSLQPEEGI